MRTVTAVDAEFRLRSALHLGFFLFGPEQRFLAHAQRLAPPLYLLGHGLHRLGRPLHSNLNLVPARTRREQQNGESECESVEHTHQRARFEYGGLSRAGICG
eukprot:5527543-Pleurochrysis_carterae.AAC.2